MEDGDLRCLPGLRRLALKFRKVLKIRTVKPTEFREYYLPEGLVCLAVSGTGVVHLDASACGDDLLILADHSIVLDFLGQACQPRVMRLDPDEVQAWISDNLGCDTVNHEW